MPQPTTVGGGGLSSLHVGALVTISEALADGRPLVHATGLADNSRLDLEQARGIVRDLVNSQDLAPRWAAVPLRWDLDFPPLDPDPARAPAEARRHQRDLSVHAGSLTAWLAGRIPSTDSPRELFGSDLDGRAREAVLARLRDPAREGGPVWAPFGALVPLSWCWQRVGRRRSA